MSAGDVAGLTIARTSELIRARKLSPLELTAAYQRRIGQLNPTSTAYITVTADRALADAGRAGDEIMAGRYRGALHGIPIAHKDLVATAGIRTTGGAKFLSDWVPAQDSTVARKLHEAGTILLGKTNTHELAFGATTNNPHYGPTRNPWRLDRIPGGSSGGSAAAIAAGLAGGATGTDTACSIRSPAALCGVVGLKPTYGRVSKAGVIPLSFLFDHVGPMTHTVEDAALMLGVMAGYDPEDASTVRVPVDDYTATLRAGIRGLRVGLPRDWFFAHLDDEVRGSVERAIGVLRGLGATVRDVSIPGVEEAVLARRGIVVTEFQQYHATMLADRPGDFGPDLRAALRQPPLSGQEIAARLRTVYRATEVMRRTLEEVDVLVTATVPLGAPRIGQETVRYAQREEESLLMPLIGLTSPFNATHLPAISVPCGLTSEGLPVGLQIAGRPFDETTVLRAAYAYEQATDWHVRQPPVVVRNHERETGGGET